MTLTGNSFSTTVPLVEGSNTITVVATDQFGNVTTVTRTVNRQSLSLTVDYPVSGTITNTVPLPVSGSVIGTGVTVTANGTPLVVLNDGTFLGQVNVTEGSNTIQIVATDATHTTKEVVRTVTIDTIPPVISNVTPTDNTAISTTTTTIQGSVTDATPVTLTLNSVSVPVNSGRFTVVNVPIKEGNNYLKIVVVDAARNKSVKELVLIGKDRTPPPAPVLFPVISPTRLNFQPLEGHAEPGSAITITGTSPAVTTQAAPGSGVFFTQVNLLTGINRLSLTATDADGNVSPPTQVTIESNPNLPLPPAGQSAQINGSTGNVQRGLTNAELPRPLVVFVTDRDGNPVPGVNVKFVTLQGGGRFVGGTDTVTIPSDAQGHAAARYISGVDPGIQVIQANFTGNLVTPAVFMAEAMQALPNGVTKVIGGVYDQNLRPLPNVILRLGGQQTRSAADGRFTLEQVPAGPHQVLEAIGRDQVPFPGRWPNISYDIDVLPGIVNRVGRPIFLPKVNDGIALPLNASNVVTQDTPYELPVTGGEPSIKVIARAGTHVTFPPDVTDKRFSVTRIPVDRVPMPLEDGRATNLYISVQPSGAIFDPPLEVTFPNDDHQPPNAKVLLMSFDHDAGRYVQVGIGHVSADGKTVSGDPGSGIRIGAWHGFPPSAPPPDSDSNGGPTCPISPNLGGKGIVTPNANLPTCLKCDGVFCSIQGLDLGNGFFWARVPSTLRLCLWLALNCAEKPKIDKIEPGRGLIGTIVEVTISGNFPGVDDGAFVDVNVDGKGIKAQIVGNPSSKTIFAKFDVGLTANPGDHNVAVIIDEKNQSNLVKFFVQIPTRIQRLSDGGTKVIVPKGDIINFFGEVKEVNVCGVYRNFVYQLVDQAGQPIKQVYTITETFSDFTGSPDIKPRERDINGNEEGIFGDTLAAFRAVPNCAGSKENVSLRQKFFVEVGGKRFDLSTVVKISMGGFSGEYKVDAPIETQ